MKESNCYHKIDYPRQQSIAAMAKMLERFAGSGEGTLEQLNQARLAASHMNELLDLLEEGENE